MAARQVIPDTLKGLAIVLMVYGHATHVGSLAAYQKLAVEIIYTFHMPIFLIVSGYFFNIKNNPYETGKALLSRIALPYLIFVTLYLIGLILIQKIGIPTSNAPPSSFIDLLDCIFLHPRGAYWFLHSLILIQICLILTKIFGTRSKLDELTLLIISLFLLAILCNYNLLLPRTTLYFLLGIIIRRFGWGFPISVKTGLFLIAIILILAKNEIFNFSFMQVVWSLSIITFLSGLCRFMEGSLIITIFAWLGRNSLIVLVLHAIFIVLLKPLSYMILKIDQTGLVYSLIVVITTILGCIYCAYLLDKIRVSKYFFGTKSIYSIFKPIYIITE